VASDDVATLRDHVLAHQPPGLDDDVDLLVPQPARRMAYHRRRHC
jgi:hypothetical protein